MNELFSMCFHSSGVGGMLFLGEIQNYYSYVSLFNCNRLIFRGNISYTPIVKEYFYNILLQDVLVNSISLDIAPSIYNSKYATSSIRDSMLGIALWTQAPLR
jgi:hypothetical protein